MMPTIATFFNLPRATTLDSVELLEIGLMIVGAEGEHTFQFVPPTVETI